MNIWTFRLTLTRRHIVDGNCGHREDLRRKKFENGETLRSRLLRGKKKSSPGRFSIPLPRDMEPVRTDEGGWASAGVDEGRETAKADGDGGGRRAALITVLYYKNWTPSGQERTKREADKEGKSPQLSDGYRPPRPASTLSRSGHQSFRQPRAPAAERLPLFNLKYLICLSPEPRGVVKCNCCRGRRLSCKSYEYALNTSVSKYQAQNCD